MRRTIAPSRTITTTSYKPRPARTSPAIASSSPTTATPARCGRETPTQSSSCTYRPAAPTTSARSATREASQPMDPAEVPHAHQDPSRHGRGQRHAGGQPPVRGSGKPLADRIDLRAVELPTPVPRARVVHQRAGVQIASALPFRIRRRAPGAELRARLCDDLSLIKAEIDTCQVLLVADGDERLSDAFDDLYAIARKTVGKASHARAVGLQ